MDKPKRQLTPEQLEEVNKLIDRLEEDEDVQNVFHNIKSSIHLR